MTFAGDLIPARRWADLRWQNSPSNWVRARRNPASNHLRAVLLEQYHVMAGNNINADWMMNVAQIGMAGGPETG